MPSTVNVPMRLQSQEENENSTDSPHHRYRSTIRNGKDKHSPKANTYESMWDVITVVEKVPTLEMGVSQ